MDRERFRPRFAAQRSPVRSAQEAALILVIGGTRGTGFLIAHRLAEQGAPVRVLARDPESARRRLASSIQIVPGDLTRPDTLPAALQGAAHVIFTAGYRSGRPARPARIRATEYEGVLHTITALLQSVFAGRFLYMTSSGVQARSLSTFLLNLYKGKTLVWRRRAEAAIRSSPLAYTIIRAGILLNRPGGKHSILVTQADLPLSLRYRIARADVAEAFVAALAEPCTIRTTFDIAWAPRGPRRPWPVLFSGLTPDAARPGPVVA